MTSGKGNIMKRHLSRFAIIAALCLAGVAHAADVGRVLLAAGDTVAIRGNQAVKLAFGTAIQDKDVLRTGPASNLQVRFIDESIVSMKESSELRIDDFRFSGKEDGNERGFLSLLKGGFRTVTGLIGRNNNAHYRLSTTTATIGIRGTDYAATLCQGDCRNNDGSLAKDGLYGRTHGISHGTNRIDVSNERDQKSFGINENFYVADAKSLVEPLLVAPDFVSNKLEGRKQGGSKGESGGSGSEQAAAGGAAAESRPSTTPEPLPQLQFVATQDLGPEGTPLVVLPLLPANGWVVVYPLTSGTEVLFDEHNPAVFNASNHLLSYGSAATAPSGTVSGGTITDTGSYQYPSGEILTWGRWTGNTQIVSLNGTALSNLPLLFGTATNLIDNYWLQPAGGMATYTYVGGPSPVDAGGNVGTITSNTLSLNFTTQSANFAMGVDFSGTNFSVSGTGTKTSGSYTGDFAGNLAGTCSGSNCASPSVTGSFSVGTGGPTSYELAVVGGGFYGTLAGPVIFLNAYESNGFTPGPLSKALAVAYGDISLGSNHTTLSQVNGASMTFSGTNLTAFSSSAGPGVFPAGNLNSGSVVETGSVAAVDGSVMQWGRWSGPTVTVIGSSATITNPPTGVPYVYGDYTSVLPASGSFTYSYAGGPNPADGLGNVGTFSGGAFSVSFGGTSTISIATPLSLTVNSANYSLTTLCSGSCTFGSSDIPNASVSGTCSGGICSTGSPVFGSLSGHFTGVSAGGLAVAGNLGSTNVTFAGAFKR